MLVNRCFMCKGDLGTIDHFLLHCAVASVFWKLALGFLNFIGFPGSIWHQSLPWEDFFLFLEERVKYRVFRAIPHAILWLLWMERNSRIFDRVETSFKQLKLERQSAQNIFLFRGRGFPLLFNWCNWLQPILGIVSNLLCDAFLTSSPIVIFY